ncbi:hypothetical protein M272_12720 [Vibrio natriegens NBRC 15636 = ATCC 14048 = DSM 759]|nr:hypothetical protein M272_12720 [Vibrio natriegens NBRC 15636 = ATCC 14048 = DSM 759]
MLVGSVSADQRFCLSSLMGGDFSMIIFLYVLNFIFGGSIKVKVNFK